MTGDPRKFYDSLLRLWEKLDRCDDETARDAWRFLEALAGRCPADNLPQPFRGAVELVHAEYRALAGTGRSGAFDELQKLLEDNRAGDEKLAMALWGAFFPEARYLDDDPDRQIALLRARREVAITEPTSDPIDSPARQIIFTSNILLSPPPADGAAPEELDDSVAEIVRGAGKVRAENQLYWYDHPVPIGIPPENDEVLHGLKGLAESLRYEKNRGTAHPKAKLRVCLSVSVTHEGLHGWARPWLKSQLGRSDEGLRDGLDVFAFTEEDSRKLANLLLPWLKDSADSEPLRSVFGVDGEYGRHYSFLKALPALWSVMRDGEVKATFKIDLDQVFPQEELSAETGKSAFEHLSSPLWGAEALDAEGRRVELGMMAGALVNEKDIPAGLFTPDIPWPAALPEGENLVFFKQRPMAVSTRGELMTRYGDDGAPDGIARAIHRIHVTGGTNGIRIDALRRHRPFTPSFVGRAEDQAYLLSVLRGAGDKGALRCVHAAGLIMRHDKEAFAGAAVKAGKTGSYVGDLLRLFVFSSYAKALPGGAEEIKKIVDPFTGCFITPIPATLAMLQLALHLVSEDGGSEDARRSVLELAGRRLRDWMDDPAEAGRKLAAAWERERGAWRAFYDALDAIEGALSSGSAAAKAAAEEFRAVIEGARITG